MGYTSTAEAYGLNPDKVAWRAYAACLDHDPDLFFPQLGGDASAARRICHGCPVKDVCLAVALANGETFGVWGGSTPRERRRLRAEHGYTGETPAGSVQRRLLALADRTGTIHMPSGPGPIASSIDASVEALNRVVRRLEATGAATAIRRHLGAGGSPTVTAVQLTVIPTPRKYL